MSKLMKFINIGGDIYEVVDTESRDNILLQNDVLSSKANKEDVIELRATCERLIERIEQNNGGTFDYEQLINKPVINDVVLSGSKSFTQLGLTELSNAELEEILK